MEGKRSDRSGVSVSIDRMTRQVRLRKLADHTARTKTKAVKTHVRKDHVKTITIDRGLENALLPQRLNFPVYACNAYHSWEKGTVENAIGRLRWFIPKGISVDGVTQAYLMTVEHIMNTTPRKILGYLTPNEYAERIRSKPSKP
jgi:IS30 family transposase